VRLTLYKAVWACNASVDYFLFQIIDAVAWSFLSCLKLRRLEYCKVPSSRPGYYSMGTLKSVCLSWFGLLSRDKYEHSHLRLWMLYLFGQRSQYISIKFPLHKQSENPRQPRRAPARDFTVPIPSSDVASKNK